MKQVLHNLTIKPEGSRPATCQVLGSRAFGYRSEDWTSGRAQKGVEIIV